MPPRALRSHGASESDLLRDVPGFEKAVAAEAALNEPAAAGDVEVTRPPLEFAEWRRRRRPPPREKVRRGGGTRRAVRQRCRKPEES